MAFPTGWTRRCALEVQSGKVESNHSDYTVLLTEDTLPSEMLDADGSHYALNGGGDIRFSSDSAGSTQLACEIITFTTNNDPANGVAEIRVKVPSVSATSNTTIYVWYHKTGETQPAVDSTYGAENAWDSNFMLVQHMNEDPSGSSPQMIDSTSNDNDGTSAGSMTTGDLVDAKVGKGLDLDGSNDEISISGLLGSNATLTLSAWGNLSTADTNGSEILSLGDCAAIRLDTSSTGKTQCFYHHSTGWNITETTIDYAGTGAHLFTAVIDPGNNSQKLYVDGVERGSSTFSDAIDYTGQGSNTKIGRHGNNGTSHFFDGIIDEVMVSNVARSADWVKTEYNNQNDPSTFVVEGTPEEMIVTFSGTSAIQSNTSNAEMAISGQVTFSGTAAIQSNTSAAVMNLGDVTIIASAYKKVSWLFTVTDSAVPTTYYWSTIARSYGGHNYVYKIDPKTFRGVTLNRGNSEIGIQTPNDLSFAIDNSGYTLSSSDFINGTVTLDLVISDGSAEETICTWKFNIKRCESVYQTLKFTCEDFIQQFLEGDFPNKPLVKDILPSNDPDIDDNVCVPQPFGTCYVPLRSIYISNQRYYVLGLASAGTYTIDKVRSPRASPYGKSEWDSGSYSFTQSTQTIDSVDWRVFQAIIKDSNGDGSADSNGLWRNGDYFYDMPTQFSCSSTASTTSPADVIAFVLEAKGVDSSYIDTGAGSSFEAAATTYAGWGLTFEYGYYQLLPFEKRLAQLLTMCHSTLRFTDKVELHVLSKTSQKTITKADVLRTGETGPGTFKYNLITGKQSDSGYIEFQVADEAQDTFVKKLVPAKGSTTDNISSSILTIPFVQDTQDAQRIGTLKYQREFLKKANISFTNKGGTLLDVHPNDVITVNHADYGGTYQVLVASMSINHNLSIDFDCIQFSEDLDDWGDLSPAVISLGTDDSDFTFNNRGTRTFTVQPYPPYEIGDLWVGGPAGDIMRCKTARASGSYQSGDWELASDYTNGATWATNITNQPGDALLLNELSCVGGYQEVALPKEDGSPVCVNCFINNHSGTAYWFKVAEFDLAGNDHACAWNGLFSCGDSFGRHTEQMRVKLCAQTDGTGSLVNQGYTYSGDDQTAILRVAYVGVVVSVYAHLSTYESCFLDGAWSTLLTAGNSWVHSEQDNADNIGTGTPTGTFLTPTKNYTVGADVTADNTADNTSNVGTVVASNVAGWAATDTTEIDGNKLSALSIDAASLKADCITAAKVGTNEIIASTANIKDAIITGVKIGNAEVDTLQIKGQAVTLPVSSYTAGGSYSSSGGWRTIQSVTVDLDGCNALITFTCLFIGTSSYVNVRLRLLRGSTKIYGDETNFIVGSNSARVCYTFQILDTNTSSSSATYYAQIDAGGTASERSLSIIGCKR